MKSLTIVEGPRSPSPENLTSEAPASTWTSVTPVAVCAVPEVGVKLTAVQFICLLLAAMS
jgi:hypothetical protein